MVFVFGECTLDLEQRELRRAGVVRALQPKAFTVLVHLLTQRHRAVSKDELLATCWPGEFVTEAALTRCLKVIRQAIGDDGGQQHSVKTLRGYGYHFIATVETPSTTSPLAAHPQLHDASRHIHEAPPGRVPTTVPANADLAPGLSVTVPLAPGIGLPCAQCQTLNRATRQFCATCGQALWRPCLHCGFGNILLNTSVGTVAVPWRRPCLSPPAPLRVLLGPIPRRPWPAKFSPVSKTRWGSVSMRRSWVPASRACQRCAR